MGTHEVSVTKAREAPFSPFVWSFVLSVVYNLGAHPSVSSFLQIGDWGLESKGLAHSRLCA